MGHGIVKCIVYAVTMGILYILYFDVHRYTIVILSVSDHGQSHPLEYTFHLLL